LDLELILAEYRAELDRRFKLGGMVNFPVGVLVIIASAMAWLASGFPYAASDTATAFFFTFMISASLAGVTVIVHVVLSHSGYEYHMLPRAAELEEEFKEFQQWKEGQVQRTNELLAWIDEYEPATFVSTASTESAEAELALRIREYAIHATDANAVNNDKKAKHLHWATTAIVVQLVFAALAGIAYLVAKQA